MTTRDVSPINLDLVGPFLPCEGLKYLVNCVDRYSRWPEANRLQDMTTITVAEGSVAIWVSWYGCPLRITTDRRRQLQSLRFSALARPLGTRLDNTAAYYRHSKGIAERLHRQLKALLGATLDRHHWAGRLALVLLGPGTTIKDDLRVSAAEILHGSSIRFPGELSGTEQGILPAAAQHLERLHYWLDELRPTLPRVSRGPPVFIFPTTDTTPHVFLRRDLIKPTLTHSHEGRFRLVSHAEITSKVEVRDKEETVSCDRVKPAYLEQ